MKKNSAATRTAGVKPELDWKLKVIMVVESVLRAQERAVSEFNQVAEKNGLLSAIELKADSLAKAEKEAELVRGVVDFLNSPDRTDREKAEILLADIDQERRRLLGCFRLASSTSVFGNAVENAQLEARMGMFATLTGPYTEIEKIAKKVLVQSQAAVLLGAGK
jgi:hypothetical protein